MFRLASTRRNLQLATRTGWMAKLPLTHRKMSTIIHKYLLHRSEILTFHHTTWHPNSSNRLPISSICNPSNRQLQGSIRCRPKRECHINSSHQDKALRPRPGASDKMDRRLGFPRWSPSVKSSPAQAVLYWRSFQWGVQSWNTTAFEAQHFSFFLLLLFHETLFLPLFIYSIRCAKEEPGGWGYRYNCRMSRGRQTRLRNGIGQEGLQDSVCCWTETTDVCDGTLTEVEHCKWARERSGGHLTGAKTNEEQRMGRWRGWEREEEREHLASSTSIHSIQKATDQRAQQRNFNQSHI